MSEKTDPKQGKLRRARRAVTRKTKQGCSKIAAATKKASSKVASTTHAAVTRTRNGFRRVRRALSRGTAAVIFAVDFTIRLVISLVALLVGAVVFTVLAIVLGLVKLVTWPLRIVANFLAWHASGWEGTFAEFKMNRAIQNTSLGARIGNRLIKMVDGWIEEREYEEETVFRYDPFIGRERDMTRAESAEIEVYWAEQARLADFAATADDLDEVDQYTEVEETIEYITEEFLDLMDAAGHTDSALYARLLGLATETVLNNGPGYRKEGLDEPNQDLPKPEAEEDEIPVPDEQFFLDLKNPEEHDFSIYGGLEDLPEIFELFAAISKKNGDTYHHSYWKARAWVFDNGQRHNWDMCRMVALYTATQERSTVSTRGVKQGVADETRRWELAKVKNLV